MCTQRKLKHYSYGTGSRGCLYDDGPHFAETRELAIAAVLEPFFDLPQIELKRAEGNLRVYGLHYFAAKYRDQCAPDYCEVVEQSGPCPESED